MTDKPLAKPPVKLIATIAAILVVVLIFAAFAATAPVPKENRSTDIPVVSSSVIDPPAEETAAETATEAAEETPAPATQAPDADMSKAQKAVEADDARRRAELMKKLKEQMAEREANVAKQREAAQAAAKKAE